MQLENPQYELESMPVRAEQVIWLPGAVGDVDALPEVFKEGFCEYLPDDAARPIYGQIPELVRFAEGDNTPDPQEVAEALSGKSGFLVQAAIPVKRYFSDTSCEYSWGWYRTEWLYAPSEADIAPVMLAWAEAMDETFKAAYRAAIAAAEAEAR